MGKYKIFIKSLWIKYQEILTLLFTFYGPKRTRSPCDTGPVEISQKAQLPEKNTTLKFSSLLKSGGWYPDEYISKSIFPSDLKLADVTPVYKKKSKNSKDNFSKLTNFKWLVKKARQKFWGFMNCFCHAFGAFPESKNYQRNSSTLKQALVN